MAMTPLTLNINAVHLTDEQFYKSQNNRELSLNELPRKISIMSPVGGESGNREADITDLVIWNRQTGLGFTFSSSTIFKLPNRADRSPDAAWILRERWEADARTKAQVSTHSTGFCH